MNDKNEQAIQALRERIMIEAQEIAERYTNTDGETLLGSYKQSVQGLLNMAGSASDGQLYADLISIGSIRHEDGTMVVPLVGPEWVLNELGLERS